MPAKVAVIVTGVTVVAIKRGWLTIGGGEKKDKRD
jgi:hypothetical protein